MAQPILTARDAPSRSAQLANPVGQCVVRLRGTDGDSNSRSSAELFERPNEDAVLGEPARELNSIPDLHVHEVPVRRAGPHPGSLEDRRERGPAGCVALPPALDLGPVVQTRRGCKVA